MLNYQEEGKIHPKPTIPITMTDTQLLGLPSVCLSCEQINPFFSITIATLCGHLLYARPFAKCCWQSFCCLRALVVCCPSHTVCGPLLIILGFILNVRGLS